MFVMPVKCEGARVERLCLGIVHRMQLIEAKLLLIINVDCSVLSFCSRCQIVVIKENKTKRELSPPSISKHTDNVAYEFNSLLEYCHRF